MGYIIMKTQTSILLLLCLLYEASAIFENEIWTTGEIDLGNGGDTLFYFLFSARKVENRKKKLLIWFNGGPGCSSSAGLFTENGPYMFFNKSEKLSYNEYSWNTDYDLMFLDQPVGVGYSRAKDSHHFCSNETCVATNFYNFIVRFLQYDHPEYAGIPLFLTGESYAGHYIPAVIGYLLRADNPLINLKGVAIGNGMMDRALQIQAYPAYLYENKRLGILPYIGFKFLAAFCSTAIPYNLYMVNFFCPGTIGMLARFANITNPYDIRRTDDDDILDNYTLKILNDVENQKLFGFKEPREVTDICNGTLYERMRPDLCSSVMSELEFALDKGLRVFMYNGVMDYQCNWRSNELVINALKWKGQAEFLKKSFRQIDYNNKAHGEYKKHENFVFMKVFDAGHMVPMDQGPFALHMLKLFVENDIN